MTTVLTVLAVVAAVVNVLPKDWAWVRGALVVLPNVGALIRALAARDWVGALRAALVDVVAVLDAVKKRPAAAPADPQAASDDASAGIDAAQTGTAAGKAANAASKGPFH
jgi:hypothetical protein